MAKVISFINDSPKRRAFFQANLTTPYETKFVQRHDALLRFSSSFNLIVGGLRSLIGNSQFDARSRSRTYGLLESLSSSSFIIALATSKKVMGLTISSSLMLQSINLDYVQAMQDITEIKETLMNWQTNDDEWTGNTFSVCKQAEDLVGCSSFYPSLRT